MADRNVIQRAFDTFGKRGAMLKQSGTWYRTTHDVTQALNLQKSQYGSSYFINVGWWLRALGDAKFPKDHQWHVGIRLESLAANRLEEVKALLDLDFGIPESERKLQLDDLLESELRPVLDRTSSVDGLRAFRREGRLNAAAVRGPAIPILD